MSRKISDTKTYQVLCKSLKTPLAMSLHLVWKSGAWESSPRLNLKQKTIPDHVNHMTTYSHLSSFETWCYVQELETVWYWWTHEKIKQCNSLWCCLLSVSGDVSPFLDGESLISSAQGPGMDRWPSACRDETSGFQHDMRLAGYRDEAWGRVYHLWGFYALQITVVENPLKIRPRGENKQSLKPRSSNVLILVVPQVDLHQSWFKNLLVCPAKSCSPRSCL